MAKKEKFGKFVLLEQVGGSALGVEFRASKLGAAGFEKLVTLLRVAPSAPQDVARRLMEEVKVAAHLQSPNVCKILGIGRVESSYYIASEFVESRTLKAIFERCRRDGFPFSVDHALLITSRICAALEHAHGRKTESGARYSHGLVTPRNVLVSYEGDVRLRGFGFWPAGLVEAGLVDAEDLLYVAPEQTAGSVADPRSDLFAVGAVLFESLVGNPLFQPGRSEDVAARLKQARLQNPIGEDDGIPRPIAEILARALALDPAARYSEMQQMRKAVDTLLFSGDFTPTTFNLAFFMHSLFREEIEQEAKLLKEEKEASYAEYLPEEVNAPPPPAAEPGPTVALPVPQEVLQEAPTVRMEAPVAAAVAPAPAPVPRPGGQDSGSFTFHKPRPRGRWPLIGGIVVVLALAGGGTFYFLRGGSGPSVPPPSTLTPEGAAALARVKELEEKLRALEAEKATAESEAAEKAKQEVEAKAKEKGQAVDPAALAKAQEEARRKAQAEHERKQEEERRRLEGQKKAEEARLAEERRKAEKAAAAAAAAPPTTVPPTTVPPTTVPPTTVPPTTVPPTTVPPPTTAPPLQPGTLVNINDAGVIAPVPESGPDLVYPPIALRQRVGGTVELNVLVDEKGHVVDVQLVSGAGGKSGLNEAAMDNVKRRRYRPATKDGIPVKVWLPVRVQFRLPH